VETPVLVDHLAGICAKEGVAIARDALGLIARAAEGSVRDSLSLLDQAIAQGGGAAGVEIPADDVRAMLGLADKTRIVALFEAAMSGKIADAIALLQAQYDEGADPAQVLLEVAEFTHLVTRVKIAPDAPLNAPTREEAEAARANAQTLSIPLLNRAWQILSKGVNETRESARPLAAADMALVRLAYAADLPSPDEALRKLGFGAGGAPVASPRAPAPRGGGANAQAHYAAATAFAPAPDSAPRAFFKNFADVVAKAGAERDIQLKTALERDVRLVRFEQGQIEFSLRPGGSAQLAQTLMRKLQDWTGERWMVALSSRAGAPSIMEGIEARAREKETGVKSHPLVRAALEAFPGAEIIAVRMADDEDAAAGPDVAFDDAVLSPIEDDEPDF
jgi:DNA polymerase-3 subunit gamma/tau